MDEDLFIHLLETDINKITNVTDKVHINTLRRIIKNNLLTPEIIPSSTLFSNKPCPHCNINTYSNKDYIICGYDKVYDWNGCGNDWCFKCGKKLCKNWFNDQLCIFHNRFHDSQCCLNKSNKVLYALTYCQCQNLHVLRG